MTPNDFPQMEITPEKRSMWRNLSYVWLVPVFALIVSLGVAWQSYLGRGVLITIEFENAAGITPKDTTIRFHDIVIGTVEEVSFTSDMAKVIVSARIDKTVAATLNPETLFWVVRPEVSARGVSGLSTVLSGVYVDSAWVPIENSEARAFVGAAQTPLIQPGLEGTRISIRTKDGSSLTAGAPVFFRGIEVGQLDTPVLSDTGDSTTVEAFINAPYDKFLTTDSRFWNMSGFSVSLGPSGLSLNVASLGALLTGGVAFDNVVSGGEPVTDSTVFSLFESETTARESVFTQLSENSVTMAVIFAESVRGLNTGALVEYRGLRVGQVSSIGAFIDRGTGQNAVRLRALLKIDPQTLGLAADADQATTIAFLESLVEDGMRAKLATTSLFSAALKIELTDTVGEEAARIGPDANGTPVIPSIPSELPDFTATAEGVLKRINNLPIEDVLNQAVSLMASIEAIASAKGMLEAPDAALGLMSEMRSLIGKDDTQAIPTELRGLVGELRGIVTDLRAQGAVDQLISALGNLDAASANIATASGDLPALIADLRAIAAKANDLKAEELLEAVTRVMDSANALLLTDGMKSIPPALASALDEVQAALRDLRDGGAIENTNAALASAREAADAVAKAAADLPDVTGQLNALVAKADELIAT